MTSKAFGVQRFWPPAYARKNIAVADVPAQLTTTPIRDPYTGNPFTWDAREGALVFIGLEPAERARHVVIY
jgi:hypothetical protein